MSLTSKLLIFQCKPSWKSINTNSMATLFTKIIRGDIPSYFIAEDDEHFAFLDINPLAKGHTLVIPKKETDYIFDLNESETLKLHLFAKKVARAVEAVVPCERMGMAVVGLEVPHAHIHLIPINRVSDINFANPKITLTPEEFEEIAANIRKAFEKNLK